VNTHRASEGVCDDHARSHADYVFLHEQLTTCGNKLAECAARCPLEGAARLSTSSNQLYINSITYVNIYIYVCVCILINPLIYDMICLNSEVPYVRSVRFHMSGRISTVHDS
jgi:hypothetical protein